ncbi:hypothetical protein [Brevundimonas lenta]|uniref:DUF4377 domain-containing protein n=1 Tax=Brevundimonas lenta TaxID=424796 RepID=A0A7W6JEE9_9CAUL|nr:hypothetical protein [Brevundimonas lenta]MBB4082602.1 hypothetical protein [Brevundimonas lenta]
MKSVLFGASLLAAALCASSAVALAFQDPSGYATPEEALRDAPDVQERCLYRAGANQCQLAVYARDGSETPRWLSAWAEPGAEFACVDRATADTRVACDAPDAVRVIVWETGSDNYLTPAEGLRHPPLAPSACLDQSGRNICTLAFIVEIDDTDTLLWRPFWATADRELICVEPVTYPEPVSCDAPGAVHYEIPRLRIRTPILLKPAA